MKMTNGHDIVKIIFLRYIAVGGYNVNQIVI